ncbi:MAG: DNA replication/repair protein RecF [Bauldia sp.]|nr:DNA replication/repair protein RecF [Bauldia sp.]
MWLSALGLANFRNYERLSLALDRRPVVLTGPNGAGKTNLLEAVSFLSPGRGLRRARLADVARRGGDGSWAVTATLGGAGDDVAIGTGIALGPEGPEATRQLRLNRTPAESTQALLEHLRVVWLTPAMDGLFTGPASDRRRFLDRLVLAVDPRHGERVNAFERAMRGRNRLLADHTADRSWLTAIEAQMAEHGVAVAAARRECVALLAGAIAETQPDGPFPAARLALEGTLETALDGAPASGVEDRYRGALATGRGADRAAGRTLDGPHLSDLAVVHAPKAMEAASCSTGEQKALLIGIVLAHARLVARLSGRTPIVLLDEVAAHLDPERRAALFAILVGLGCQAWMTGTEPAPFTALGDAAQHFAVPEDL